jgi:hypothetical protein
MQTSIDCYRSLIELPNPPFRWIEADFPSDTPVEHVRLNGIWNRAELFEQHCQLEAIGWCDVTKAIVILELDASKQQGHACHGHALLVCYQRSHNAARRVHICRYQLVPISDETNIGDSFEGRCCLRRADKKRRPWQQPAVIRQSRVRTKCPADFSCSRVYRKTLSPDSERQGTGSGKNDRIRGKGTRKFRQRDWRAIDFEGDCVRMISIEKRPQITERGGPQHKTRRLTVLNDKLKRNLQKPTLNLGVVCPWKLDQWMSTGRE